VKRRSAQTSVGDQHENAQLEPGASANVLSAATVDLLER
jgi:hypothetical protein